MFQNLEVFRLASAMARHAAARQAIVAENMANSDTPGFRARDIPPFSAVVEGGGGMAMRATRPAHLHGGGPAPQLRPFETAESADPNGNSVSIEQEMLRAVAARREYDRALAIYRASLNILRTAIGRA